VIIQLVRNKAKLDQAVDAFAPDALRQRRMADAATEKGARCPCACYTERGDISSSTISAL